jgi:hypothetical protein
VVRPTGTGPRHCLDDGCCAKRGSPSQSRRSAARRFGRWIRPEAESLRRDRSGTADPVGCLRIVCSKSMRWQQGSTCPEGGVEGWRLVATARCIQSTSASDRRQDESNAQVIQLPQDVSCGLAGRRSQYNHTEATPSSTNSLRTGSGPNAGRIGRRMYLPRCPRKSRSRGPIAKPGSASSSRSFSQSGVPRGWVRLGCPQRTADANLAGGIHLPAGACSLHGGVESLRPDLRRAAPDARPG